MDASIRDLRVLFARLLAGLREQPAEQVAARLRMDRGDVVQRLAVGRGVVPALPVEDIRSTFSVADTPFEPVGDPTVAFVEPTSAPAFATLDGVVRLAARLAVPEEFASEKLFMTLFVHRVVVRPGEFYAGFIHRDIAMTGASVGTAIFYPTVASENIDGAQLGVHLSDLPIEALDRRAPDVAFTPAEYDGAALVMSYPHNLVHGVQPGTNRSRSLPDATRTTEDKIQDFFEPGDDVFVKDMAILVFSKDISAVED